MCWIAPLMPQAMYRSGAMRVPVWPICWACGRQPRLVATRDTPTAAPSSAASSSSIANASALPIPRPPPTTTLASASDTPVARGDVATDDPRAQIGIGDGRRDPRRPWLAPPAAGSARGRNGVRRDGQEARRAVEHRVLEQAASPALTGHPPRFAGLALTTTLAAIGCAGPRRDVGEHLGRAVARRARRRRRTTQLATTPATAAAQAAGA